MEEKVYIDERGRITIPKKIRDKYNFIPGLEIEVIDKKGKIILKRRIPKQKKVNANVEWGKNNTFFKAGQYTFEDNND